jgi:hypothetical protein
MFRGTPGNFAGDAEDIDQRGLVADRPRQRWSSA